MSLLIVGVDPGLRSTGLCLMHLGKPNDAQCSTISEVGDWRLMADLIADWIVELEVTPDVIGVEDFTFRSPRVTKGLVKHAAEMGKLIGRLSIVLRGLAGQTDPTWVKAHESKALQPEGKLAKRMGIPGRNDHERSAYYVALWVASTVRLAGGRA